MSALVVDASVAAAWCFSDEATAKSDAILEHVKDHGALVPSLWHLEIANVLRQAERRNRISEADAGQALAILEQLPITIDTETMAHAWSRTAALARQMTLTLYDAAYLELAIRKGLSLASKDKELIAAAKQCGCDTRAC